MPRLNGKFVSQETYDAAMAEEIMMDESNDFDSAQGMEDEIGHPEEGEGKIDRRRGPRAGTALKKAMIAQVQAAHKLAMAESRLAAFETKRDALADAVNECANALAAVEEAVAKAQAELGL